jgi:hypothetical protein
MASRFLGRVRARGGPVDPTLPLPVALIPLGRGTRSGSKPQPSVGTAGLTDGPPCSCSISSPVLHTALFSWGHHAYPPLPGQRIDRLATLRDRATGRDIDGAKAPRLRRAFTGMLTPVAYGATRISRACLSPRSSKTGGAVGARITPVGTGGGNRPLLPSRSERRTHRGAERRSIGLVPGTNSSVLNAFRHPFWFGKRPGHSRQGHGAFSISEFS